MIQNMDSGMMWPRTIGIAGGLGPYAHAAFELLLLESAARHLERPPKDQDFPPWVLSSYPGTPDRTRALLGEVESPAAALALSISRLSGADFAVIPCNTAHCFLDEVKAACSLPILDMVGETVRRVAMGNRRVGLLATTGTLMSGIYQETASRHGAELDIVSTLDLANGDALQEELVMTPIYGPLREGVRQGGGIKSVGLDAAKAEELSAPLEDAVRRLGDAGAECVILGCTEIPLAVRGDELDWIPLIDPMAVAADACIAIAAGERELPAR